MFGIPGIGDKQLDVEVVGTLEAVLEGGVSHTTLHGIPAQRAGSVRHRIAKLLGWHGSEVTEITWAVSLNASIFFEQIDSRFAHSMSLIAQLFTHVIALKSKLIQILIMALPAQF